MPNSRRRRFSVHNGNASREDHCRIQTGDLQTRVSETIPEVKPNISMNSFKSKNKMQPNSSKNSNVFMETIADTESLTSTLRINRQANSISDKDVTESSSNIITSNIRQSLQDDKDAMEKINSQNKRNRPITREVAALRQDKYPHQHRVKVRSPKRRPPSLETQNPPPVQKIYDTNKQTKGTEAIDWSKEVVIRVVSANVEETTEEEERLSDHSMDDMCRICHGGDLLSPELGPLISACACRGTVGRVHVKCLERWLTESGKSRCELCGTRYATRRVHRYGVPRALVMWILSQNAKQLMVDSLGIMLMSPLAVLAAWLSGRTLAGLMTQDTNVTPWPLASTFVLACMTLVCYYCWIVSAVTRHALGWWIWYRSQYEVRLTLESEE